MDSRSRPRRARGVDPAGGRRVRLPVDWDSVDPIPAALAEILDRPVVPGVELDLDDVVPGEPAPAPKPEEVHA